MQSIAMTMYKPLCTNKFIVAFFVPMLFLATHWYKPLSTGLKFMIVRFPSFTSVLPTGKGETSLIQVSLGGGYPSAWQVDCIAVDSTFETSDEGTLVKTGSPNRRRKLYLAEMGYELFIGYLINWLFNYTDRE